MTPQPPPAPAPLSVLTVNIGAPSRERAARQLAWLAARPEHVLALTETADSDGCAWLADRFTTAGYHVVFPRPEGRDRGVMLVSRAAPAPTDAGAGAGWALGFLPCRAATVTVQTTTGPVEVTALYVPSRDATPDKVARKQRFLAELTAVLPAAGTGAPRVIAGDLNVLEPGHRPRYRFFQPFEYDFYRGLLTAGYRDAFRNLHPDAAEYSWVGRTGDGYRYDHAFTDPRLHVPTCAYDHQTRAPVTRLTDHSALALTLDRDPAVLDVTDPTAVPEPGALF